MAALTGGAVSKYNNDPGSGRTGYWEVPPNNYDFYSEAEKYKPNVQADGGILSSARHPSWMIRSGARGNVASGKEPRLRARRAGRPTVRLGPPVTSPPLTRAPTRTHPDAEPMYNPTPEQADADRQKAYETGVPHGA